jgi:type II secretory pathway component PulM
LKSADLYFVLGSFCLCVLFFSWLVMPKVQQNRAARARLHEIVAEARELVGSTRRIEQLTEALGDDTYIKTYMRRLYLEEQGRPWPREGDMGADNAGYPESR